MLNQQTNPLENPLAEYLAEFLQDILELQQVGELAKTMSVLLLLIALIGGCFALLKKLASKAYAIVEKYAQYQFGNPVNTNEVVQREAPEVYFEYFQAPTGHMRGWVFSCDDHSLLGQFQASSRIAPTTASARRGEFPEMAVKGAQKLRPAGASRQCRMVVVSGPGGSSLGLASVLSIAGEFYLVTADHVAKEACGIYNFVGDVGLPFPPTTISYCDVSFSKIEKSVLSQMRVRASGSPTGAKSRPATMIVLRGDVATVDVLPLGVRKPDDKSQWNFAFYHQSITQPGDSGGLILQGERPVAIHVGADRSEGKNVAINLGPLVDLLFRSDESKESRVNDSYLHHRVDPSLLAEEHILAANVLFNGSGTCFAPRGMTKQQFRELISFKAGRWGDDAVQDDYGDDVVRDDFSDDGSGYYSVRSEGEANHPNFGKVSSAAQPTSKPQPARESTGPVEEPAKKKRRRKPRGKKKSQGAQPQAVASLSSEPSPRKQAMVDGVKCWVIPVSSKPTSPASQSTSTHPRLR